jgi:hypothetical protein
MRAKRMRDQFQALARPAHKQPQILHVARPAPPQVETCGYKIKSTLRALPERCSGSAYGGEIRTHRISDSDFSLNISLSRNALRGKGEQGFQVQSGTKKL